MEDTYLGSSLDEVIQKVACALLDSSLFFPRSLRSSVCLLVEAEAPNDLLRKGSGAATFVCFFSPVACLIWLFILSYHSHLAQTMLIVYNQDVIYAHYR